MKRDAQRFYMSLQPRARLALTPEEATKRETPASAHQVADWINSGKIVAGDTVECLDTLETMHALAKQA